MIVVAGIERDPLGGARLHHAAHHVERAIAIERRDLDGDHVLDGRKAAPERHRQDETADGGLQVEPDQRNFARDRLRMRDQFVLARALERGEREQPGVIAETARDLRFLDRLRRAAGEPGDHDRRLARPLGGAAHGELEHRREQPGLADGELGGVDADGQPARAGVEVVASERALAARVELAIGIERERMRRHHHALAQRGEHLRGPVLPAQCHERPQVTSRLHLLKVGQGSM